MIRDIESTAWSDDDWLFLIMLQQILKKTQLSVAEFHLLAVLIRTPAIPTDAWVG
jgi:hypothetical protein